MVGGFEGFRNSLPHSEVTNDQYCDTPLGCVPQGLLHFGRCSVPRFPLTTALPAIGARSPRAEMCTAADFYKVAEPRVCD
jgi:hypothetical protein